ncbi:CLUMA_CG011480, isoform A [Clunio marinus]|uniref:Citrate transport protein n=1 Tax=Clunio marinus TaxID=568069 RepID=A0A1J1ICZ7_9DIPT|nr:CLUMA_CG011480, isoform A [Clunio marinus]
MAWEGRKYKHEKSENFDEYMKALGVGLVLRKMGNTINATCFLEKNGDEFSYHTVSTFKTTVVKFKLGVESEQETLDGRKVMTTYTLDGNTLTQVEKGEKKSVITRVFSETEMVATCIYEMDEAKKISFYRHLDYPGLSSNQSKILNPFLRRPWMTNTSAAAPSGGSKGLKGIVAGGNKRYDGIVDCVKKTVKERGFFGLYRGLSVLLYGSIPKSAVRFGGFEQIKIYLVDEEGNLSGGGKLIAGLGAGVLEAIFAVTPMETVKVKFINDQRSKNPKFRGFAHGVGCIVKQEGFSGLYKGVTATIIKQGSNQAIRFYVMETLREWYKGGDKKKETPKLLVGLFGAIAGAASVFGNTPIDVVKTRMQGLEAAKYKNTLDCAVKIWKNEGPFAFYKGTVPRLSRVCLDVAITFMIYDSFMDLFNKFWK